MSLVEVSALAKNIDSLKLQEETLKKENGIKNKST